MILVVPKKTISVQMKNELTKKGHIIIECDDPEKVKVINPESPVETNDLFMSALHAISSCRIDNAGNYFVKELYERLSPKKVAEPPPTNSPEKTKKPTENKTVLKEPIRKF